MIVSIFFFKQKTAYEMRISDWSSDVCSSDLGVAEIIRVVAWRVVQVAFGIGVVARDQGVETAQIGHQRLVALAQRQRPGAEYQRQQHQHEQEIGRASCRERVCQYV